ncbi:MAG: hypothetical protein ACI9ES_002438 [Oceanospirillaceae bacterium]|jgi:hypothetical protein
MTGNVIHITSAMIPIFIMPIAVLDGDHTLSDFYDRYPALKDKHKNVTACNTDVGFGSLALFHQYASTQPIQATFAQNTRENEFATRAYKTFSSSQAALYYYYGYHSNSGKVTFPK